MSTRQIFINPTGQQDNLGDSVLRRPYLDALRQQGELHVLVVDGTDYASALGLCKEDAVYHSRAGWLRSVLNASARGGAVFALNAGEVVTGSGYTRRALWQLVLSAAVRIRGGRVIAAGLGVRSSGSTAPLVLRSLASNADVLAWRDPVSADLVAPGSSVMPDWAFSTGSAEQYESSPRRDTVAIALRGDRPAPNQEWIDAAKSWAASRGHRLSVVVQVRRDGDLASKMADALDCDLLGWPSERSHADHEAVVRHEYSRCVGVISDRIHALILGLTEGAAPIAWSTVSVDKASRVFGHVSSLPIATMLPLGQEPDRWDAIIGERRALADALADARVEIGEVRMLIGGALNPDRKPLRAGNGGVR